MAVAGMKQSTTLATAISTMILFMACVLLFLWIALLYHSTGLRTQKGLPQDCRSLTLEVPQDMVL